MRYYAMKLVLVIAWLAGILVVISCIFWKQDVKYSLPTPVPVKYSAVAHGAKIDLAGRLGDGLDDKPLFIHFFNPSCPCSRFNIQHVRSLIRHYHNDVNFAVVVLAKSDNTLDKQDIQEKFGTELPVSFDSTIAADCGVYSTPQAVLLDAQHRLYYRGNYNKSRYCTNKNSNYAQMALDSFLADPYSKPAFSQSALKAYGCQLPVCTKN